MAELLLELFSEEIPARMQAKAAEDLKRLVTDKLKEARLEFSHAEAHVTPRRLALVVDGLPAQQPDLLEERKGPRVGSPDQAIQGFLKSAGLMVLDQCEKRMVGNAEFYFAVRKIAGRKTAEVLPDIVLRTIGELPWPKSMRSGMGNVPGVWATDQGQVVSWVNKDSDRIVWSTPFRWVRPLQSIACVFDSHIVPGVIRLERGEIKFGNKTRGHRFLAPKPFAVKSFADYRDKLRAAHVMLDREERKRVIAEGAPRLAAAEGLTVKDDPALLEEVCGLVEWPVPLIGSIDRKFMEVPREVLTSTMRANQKYFSLETRDGELAPRFILVANMVAKDGGAAIVAGNERVLRARLSDAKFFWDQDRKVKLEERVPKLHNLIFHAKLGTVGDKVARLQVLAAEVAAHVPGAYVDRVRSAALLCKADLVSGMVGEFPELQGIMGRYYALHEGEDPAVADAIADHYAPRGPDDRCPTAPVSVAVALADKIDTLVGFFAIDEKPTGSKDPYALRRAALGVIRLVVENRLRLPLYETFRIASRLYHDQDRAPSFDAVGVRQDLLDFFADRLRVHLREKAVRHDLVTAVFALGGEDDLVRLLARVEALAKFLESEDGANLLTAYKRASNIVRIEEKKDNAAYDGGADSALLAEPEEKLLFDGLGRASEEIRAAVEREDFAGAMAALAKLRPPVDAFFDRVTVNCADRKLRANRLKLLSAIRSALGGVADFSRIEG
jgi:glycyl-tRNA synthetase beta chain